MLRENKSAKWFANGHELNTSFSPLKTQYSFWKHRYSGLFFLPGRRNAASSSPPDPARAPETDRRRKRQKILKGKKIYASCAL